MYHVRRKRRRSVKGPFLVSFLGSGKEGRQRRRSVLEDVWMTIKIHALGQSHIFVLLHLHTICSAENLTQWTTELFGTFPNLSWTVDSTEKRAGCLFSPPYRICTTINLLFVAVIDDIGGAVVWALISLLTKV